MFDNAVLDVVIGLVFIYLLYNMLATIPMEIIATNAALRGWVLQKAIERMLDDGATSLKKSDETSDKKSRSLWVINKCGG